MSKFKFTYEGPYVVHRRKMLESDAYKSLGKTEMKILARLEIELMRHRGTNNGRIICTYDDFAKYGIRRPSIPIGLRQLRRVGLLVVTQRGRRDALRNPHHYRLPYLATYDDAGNIIAPTDEWKKYRSNTTKKQSKMAAQRKSPVTKTYLVPVTKTYLVPVTKTYLWRRETPGTKTYLLSIIYPYSPA